MKKLRMQFDKPLTVSVENGVLNISIGLGLLAFAVQAPDTTDWPEGFYIADVREFGREFAAELRREQEDGTTPVHRLFDKVAVDLLESGAASVEEGDVKNGIAAACAAIERSALPSGAVDAAPSAPPEHSWFSKAALDVTAERRRQIETEGFFAGRDESYENGELERAGAAYALVSSRPGGWFINDIWPFRSGWWKPRSHRENLVRAAALLIAAIEKIDRAESRS